MDDGGDVVVLRQRQEVTDEIASGQFHVTVDEHDEHDEPPCAASTAAFSAATLEPAARTISTARPLADTDRLADQ